VHGAEALRSCWPVVATGTLVLTGRRPAGWRTGPKQSCSGVQADVGLGGDDHVCDSGDVSPGGGASDVGAVGP
jgi:hypothetical protein